MNKALKWVAAHVLDIAVIIMLMVWLNYRDKSILNINICPITDATPPSINGKYRI